MDKLKLLLVTHDLNIGGLQKLVIDIALNIDRARFDVAVCCLRESGPMAKELVENDIPIFEINQVVDGKINYFSFVDVYRLLKNEKVDIIHTHNTNPFIDGGVAAILARTPVRIHTDHAREYPDKQRYMIAERVLSVFYDKIVAVSEQTKSNLVNYEKINPSRIITIQNGVSIKSEITSHRKDKDSSLANKFIIGTVGRLCKAKGYEYLVRAMTHLLKYTDNFELQIIGDGNLMGELQELSESLSLTDNVKFMGEQNDIDSFYQDFDLFVISSISEGLPLVLLEAMANKIPVLTTGVGGIPGVVKNGRSALIVKPYEPEEIAEGVWSLMNNECLRHDIATNAYSVLQKQFGINEMMTKYEQLYLEYFTKNARAHA